MGTTLNLPGFESGVYGLRGSGQSYDVLLIIPRVLQSDIEEKRFSIVKPR